jgi:hypothetical protein
MMAGLGFTASIDTKKLCGLRILRRDPDAEARVTRDGDRLVAQARDNRSSKSSRKGISAPG